MKKWLHFILIVLANCISGLAQPTLVFKHWSIKDGLSHNFVREILQDTEGFIWVATEDGLNQFNGYTFQIYLQANAVNKISISHPIMALAEDKYGNIWVGTWGAGIYIYNKKSGQFKQLTHSRLVGQAASHLTLSSDFIYDLYADSQENMWIGTADNGIDKINLTTWAFTHYGESYQNKSGLSSSRAISLTEDQNRNIWIATLGGGLNRLNPATGQIKVYKHSVAQANSLADNKTYCVISDKQNRVWVGTWAHGLDLFDPVTETFTHFRHNPTDDKSLPNDQVWALTQSRNGSIWIGTDEGLAVYNESSKQFDIYKNDPYDGKSLSANTIKSLYTDHQDRIWIGFYNNGINLYDKYLSQIGHYYKRLYSNMVIHNEISAFEEDEEGNILIGSDGGGLSIYQSKKQVVGSTTNASGLNKIAYFQHENGNAGSLASNKIKTLLKDHRNHIWIGYWAGGLDCFDWKKNKIKHYSIPPPSEMLAAANIIDKQGKYLRSNNVVCLAEDKDGLLWIGTFGGGLHSLDPITGQFTYYEATLARDINIWSIFVDSQNRIWVGSSRGHWEVFTKDKKSLKLLIRKQENHAIYDIREDARGDIWIATAGGGLQCVNQKFERVTSFTQDDGLPSNGIQAIEFDNQNTIWVSTNRGLVSIDPRSRNVRVFDAQDGVQSLQFNRQSSAYIRSGALLFGGNNGFNFFDPKNLQMYERDFPITFTDFEIFNKAVPVGDSTSPLTSPINYLQSIQLTYKESVISINFAALDYSAPEKLAYRYRLKGFVDESWQKADESRKVTYTNLEPGNYTFEVSYLLYGVPSAHTRSLFIRIVPPIWKTWWARLVMLLGFSGVLAGFYFLRIRSIRSANIRLEKQVKARTSDLQRINTLLLEKSLLIQEQNEEIETQAEELTESNNLIRSINTTLEQKVERRTRDLKKINQELDNFVYRVSHDIRAPLSSLTGLITLMNEEKDSAQLQTYRDMAMRSVLKLDGFVKDILDYSRNSRMDIRSEQIQLPELINAIWQDLEYIKNASRVKLIVQSTQSANYYGDLTRLQIIFQNMLSNAIKYQNLQMENPYLKIVIRVEEKQVFLELEDNGIGIDESRIGKVFDMFYRASELSTGSGIGLYIVKETVEKLNGSIEIQSVFGEGTTFYITLPNQLADL